MICQGTGCTNTAIAGASFCSEDHFDELEHERRSRNGFRTATPVNGKDYSAHLPPSPKNSQSTRVEADKLKPVAAPLPSYMATRQAPKSEPKKPGRPVKWDRKAIEADAHLSAKQLVAKYGIARSTAMRIRKEQGTSKAIAKSAVIPLAPVVNKIPAEPTKAPPVAPAPSTGMFASVIEELERQRERLTAQLKAIEQAIEALRNVS